ncbi:MAG: hypothetical protein WCT05_10735 [Lentisphaeria bacterium]
MKKNGNRITTAGCRILFIGLLLTLSKMYAASSDTDGQEMNFASFFQEGVRLAGSGDYETATRHLQAGLQQDWNSVERRRLLTYLGSLNTSRDPEQAWHWLLQAIMTPCSSELIYLRTFLDFGEFLYRQDHCEAAIGAAENVTARKHAHSGLLFSAHFLIARSYQKLELTDQAIFHYQKAVEAGKNVPYKFNYSVAEKALQQLQPREAKP